MYEYFIGFRHLRSRARASLSTIAIISILGVFLGVMALVAVISVTGGFQETFRDKVLGVNSHVLVMSNTDENISEYRLYQTLIEAEIDGVVATSPFIFNEMMIASRDQQSGILIKGIDPALLPKVSDLPEYLLGPDGEKEKDPKVRAALVEQLHFDRYTHPNKARCTYRDLVPADDPIPAMMMGSALAKKLGVGVGAEICVVSPQRSIGGDPLLGSSGEGLTQRPFKVIGLYNSGFFDYDNKLVLVHYTAIQDFFGQKDTVTGVEIKIADIFSSTEIRDELRALLEGQTAHPRFRIIDWKDLNKNLFKSLELQKIVLTIIMTFIIIVASFNIVGTLIMLVLDKQKEIAILKSMGASDGGVMRIFIFQGLFIGGLGTLLGLLGGYLLCLTIRVFDFGLDPQVYMIDSLPVKMVPLEFTIVGLSAILISFLATLYPSWWATQLEPVEGLRYE